MDLLGPVHPQAIYGSGAAAPTLEELLAGQYFDWISLHDALPGRDT